jgi:outer membrane protein TolC
MTTLSQRLPAAGKRATRAQIADQDVAVAHAELDRVRLAIIADTRRAWWSL